MGKNHESLFLLGGRNRNEWFFPMDKFFWETSMMTQQGEGYLLRRAVLVLVFAVLAAACGTGAQAADPTAPDVEHPMMKPAAYTDKGKCENCGMGLNMWARTRHGFRNSEGEHHVCSPHCMADLSAKAGEKPQEVKAAVYLAPEKMVDAAQAAYVVGSAAKGTMSAVSQVVFENREEAAAFAKEYGGEVMGLDGVLEKATAALPDTRKMIAGNRMKKGKITEPGKQEGCAACGMHVAMFPKHMCQLSTTDNKNLHFCSTGCLNRYLDNPASYGGSKEQVGDIWVTIYPEGGSDYAKGLYYVTGSSVMGSMGPEALPFRLRAEAEAFAREKGGKVMKFGELTPALIQGKP